MIDHHCKNCHITHLIAAICFALACLAVVLVCCWLVFSKQDSKLYEADNMVCVSQPGDLQCFERKPR